MMAKLVNKVKKDLSCDISNITYWTDSTIVLSWLKTPPHLLNIFVANRVTQIADISDISQWRYIPTLKNPADLLTKGVNPSQLLNLPVWWHGPDFLSRSSSEWPNNFQPNTGVLPELKAKTTVFVNVQINQNLVINFKKFSKMLKLKRIMAYCLRFLKNCQSLREDRLSGALSFEEIDKALTALARLSQIESFNQDYKLVASKQPLAKCSKLKSLSPFFSEPDNVMRVTGRLYNSTYSLEKRCPIIISAKHHFTKLLFRDIHEASLHIGPQQLLYNIREKFWPIGGRNLSKNVVHQCLTCFRFRPKGVDNLLGHLPKDRVKPNLPFTVVGTDFFGPFLIKDRDNKKFNLIKIYVCLFICFSTRAIHLEPVLSLTTDAFISCLRCLPSKIYSDNGRNFCGAQTKLNELQAFLIKNESSLVDSASVHNISWSFIPPYSPNFGGVWEAGVKSAKFHMKRVMQNSLLTYSQFQIVIIQIEGILNSRPISPISAHPDDLLPLTPSHFLIGRAISTVPDKPVIDIPTNRLKLFQRLQKIVQGFWSRWSKEYISEMQTRNKWMRNNENIRCGSLVLVKEDALPPFKWKLGRVVAVHPGLDSVVRVVSIRTKDHVLKRCISKICPLPNEND